MIRRAIRWCLVAIVAFGLRRGVTKSDMRVAIGRAFPRRDWDWKERLLDAGMERNGRRLNHA